MQKSPFRGERRGALLRFGAALVALAARPRLSLAQPVLNPEVGTDARMINTPEGAIKSILKGAPMRRGRVKLELPKLAENGHSVALTVSVESPMTEQDHVRRIDLVSEKNPVPHMATFLLGARAGRAEIGTRVRLNGTQRMTAIAELSDGSFWFDTFDVTVTEAACLDGG
jgi:sulfur-oxidizing protein SoxY